MLREGENLFRNKKAREETIGSSPKETTLTIDKALLPHFETSEVKQKIWPSEEEKTLTWNWMCFLYLVIATLQTTQIGFDSHFQSINLISNGTMSNLNMRTNRSFMNGSLMSNMFRDNPIRRPWSLFEEVLKVKELKELFFYLHSPSVYQKLAFWVSVPGCWTLSVFFEWVGRRTRSTKWPFSDRHLKKSLLFFFLKPETSLPILLQDQHLLGNLPYSLDLSRPSKLWPFSCRPYCFFYSSSHSQSKQPQCDWGSDDWD